jgi:hypothetical protein
MVAEYRWAGATPGLLQQSLRRKMEMAGFFKRKL